MGGNVTSPENDVRRGLVSTDRPGYKSLASSVPLLLPLSTPTKRHRQYPSQHRYDPRHTKHISSSSCSSNRDHDEGLCHLRRSAPGRPGCPQKQPRRQTRGAHTHAAVHDLVGCFCHEHKLGVAVSDGARKLPQENGWPHDLYGRRCVVPIHQR